MSEYKAKKTWFEIEEQEYLLNLCCENKFAYFIFINQITRPYIIQDLSQKGLYDNFNTISDYLTPATLSKYKAYVTNGELQSF